MNAPLVRLQTEQQPGFGRRSKSDRRRETRYSAWFKGRLHSSDGQKEKILIADVSIHGCSIRTEATWLRVGRFVAVSVDGGTKQDAIVRWVRDGAAGMEFLRPIPSNARVWADLLDAPV